MFEDTSTNRMVDALELFEEVDVLPRHAAGRASFMTLGPGLQQRRFSKLDGHPPAEQEGSLRTKD